MRKFLNVLRVACRRYSEVDVIHAFEVGSLLKRPIEGVFEKVWEAKSWSGPLHRDALYLSCSVCFFRQPIRVPQLR